MIKMMSCGILRGLCMVSAPIDLNDDTIVSSSSPTPSQEYQLRFLNSLIAEDDMSLLAGCNDCLNANVLDDEKKIKIRDGNTTDQPGNSNTDQNSDSDGDDGTASAAVDQEHGQKNISSGVSSQ